MSKGNYELLAVSAEAHADATPPPAYAAAMPAYPVPTRGYGGAAEGGEGSDAGGEFGGGDFGDGDFGDDFGREDRVGAGGEGERRIRAAPRRGGGGVAASSSSCCTPVCNVTVFSCILGAIAVLVVASTLSSSAAWLSFKMVAVFGIPVVEIDVSTTHVHVHGLFGSNAGLPAIPLAECAEGASVGDDDTQMVGLCKDWLARGRAVRGLVFVTVAALLGAAVFVGLFAALPGQTSLVTFPPRARKTSFAAIALVATAALAMLIVLVTYSGAKRDADVSVTTGSGDASTATMHFATGPAYGAASLAFLCSLIIVTILSSLHCCCTNVFHH